MRNNVIYTGAFRFPDKDAASQRVLGIGKCLRNVGYRVTYCGWEQKPREEDKISDKHIYQGFEYYSQSELDASHSNFFLKLFNIVFKGRKTIKWIKRKIKEEKVDYIIAYNSNSYFLLSLFLLCTRKKIKFICDCTEWYDGDHLPGGKFGIPNIDNNLRIRIVYPIVKNIIVISSFLKDYLDKKRCKTIVIPPLVDLEEHKWKEMLENSLLDFSTIDLIYAGEAGKKDLIKPILEVVSSINKEKVYFRFNILGTTEYELKKVIKTNEYDYFINYLGRVKMNEVPQIYAKSHFSVLMRDNKRYANAGFPTKFVESLSCGIPVIANDTSDISKYIEDTKNGFLLSGNPKKELEDVLNYLKRLDIMDYEIMKKNAFKTSLKSFDIKNYDEKIKKYLNMLKQQYGNKQI